MLTSPAHQPASQGCNCPSDAVAYQLFTSSATWSRHMNGMPTAYTKTISNSSATTELRSRIAEEMAASNRQRAAGAMRPLVTKRCTIGDTCR